MPNPLTDELSEDAKDELAAVFAAMRARFADIDPEFQINVSRIATRRMRQVWELR